MDPPTNLPSLGFEVVDDGDESSVSGATTVNLAS